MSINQNEAPHYFDGVPLDPIYLEGGIAPVCRICGGSEDDGVHKGLAGKLARQMVAKGVSEFEAHWRQFESDNYTVEAKLAARSAVDLIILRLKEIYAEHKDAEGDDQYVAFFQYWDELIDELTETSRELEV